MSESVEAVRPASVRGRSIEDRLAARRRKYEREKLIVEYLNRGISVPEIAANCGLTEKHMRACIRETLARRMPAPPAEFLAIQVSRLNEALLVAYSAMSMTNLRAVDRVVKIVRELDRYHGFVAAERRVPDFSRLSQPAEGLPALGPPPTDGRQTAPQALEKVDTAPEDELALEALDPEDMAERLRTALTSRLAAAQPQTSPAFEARNGRREAARQAQEKTESAIENDVAREAAAVAARLRTDWRPASLVCKTASRPGRRWPAAGKWRRKRLKRRNPRRNTAWPRKPRAPRTMRGRSPAKISRPSSPLRRSPALRRSRRWPAAGNSPSRRVSPRPRSGRGQARSAR